MSARTLQPAQRAARLLILHNEGAVPHDWLCECYSSLVGLSKGDAPTAAQLHELTRLESMFAAELTQLT